MQQQITNTEFGILKYGDAIKKNEKQKLRAPREGTTKEKTFLGRSRIDA